MSLFSFFGLSFSLFNSPALGISRLIPKGRSSISSRQETCGKIFHQLLGSHVVLQGTQIGVDVSIGFAALKYDHVLLSDSERPWRGNHSPVPHDPSSCRATRPGVFGPCLTRCSNVMLGHFSATTTGCMCNVLDMSIHMCVLNCLLTRCHTMTCP